MLYTNKWYLLIIHSTKEHNFVKVVRYNNDYILLLLSPSPSPSQSTSPSTSESTSSPQSPATEPPVVVLRMAINVLKNHRWVPMSEAQHMLDLYLTSIIPLS